MNAFSEEPGAGTQARAADHDRTSLRLWLQLLTCTALIERHVREKLRYRFDITLPRFDMLAQLDREPKGLLMVTGGNVTGLTDQLVAEGLVVRRAIPGDRRAYNVRLTPKGKRQFDAMSGDHERWIVELLDGVAPDARIALHESLARLKTAITARLDAEHEARR